MTTSLTGQAQAALSYLHRQARGKADNFDLERIDRALDEIVRLRPRAEITSFIPGVP
jgi:hypothetical protein